MRRMLSIEEAGDAIVSAGRRMYERGYVAANDGNISARISEERCLVTPAGVSKGFMTRSDLVVTDMKGRKISGKREPSSEIKMHLRAYELRADVGAVVHAHPPYATAYAVAGIPLEGCILPEVVLTLGSVPLAAYGTPSTQEVPESIEAVVTRCDAFLLRNHGVMTVGGDVLGAYHKIETVEHFAHISFLAAQLGKVGHLAPEDVRKLVGLREHMGLGGPYPGCVDPVACAAGEDSDKTRLVKMIVEEVVKILGESKHAMD
jgi:L-fuculose-phosphate aldolase